MRIRALASAFSLALIFAPAPASAAAPPGGPDIHDTRLMSEPAISADRIAFIYAGDLWTANRDGRNFRRLTSDVGAESNPAFSPDGKWIAFSAQYEGNVDMYVVSAEGGVPRRLTYSYDSRLTTHSDFPIVNAWVVENEGVAPDIEVEQTPADVIAGRDPQLEKAIAVVMEELKKSPREAPKRPAYPIKTAKGS